MAPVTVVVPVYRDLDTVVEALESVRRQTVPPERVIVVDDGSDDGTADLVAERFPDLELVRQQNSGPSAARNVGWRLATTEWVAFLDADDVFEPERLAAQLALAAAEPSVGLVASNWASPAAPAPPLRPERAYGAGDPASHCGAPEVREITTLDIILLNRFQTSTVLVRREVLEAVGGLDPEMDGTEDWDCWLRCSRRGRVLKIERPLVRYRDTPASYSKDADRVRASMRRLMDRELPRSGLTARQQAEVRAWHELRYGVSMALRHDWRGALGTVADLRRQGLAGAAPVATARYLVPFLVRRRIRRHRPVQPLRLKRRWR